VPVVGGEQMYQALKSLVIDTELIIYPNQFHGITVPSYKVDRYKRYLAWYDKYLKGTSRTTPSAGK
jgi:dipeptidyl aminopeptidase/acylaminoacyl peptidase